MIAPCWSRRVLLVCVLMFCSAGCDDESIEPEDDTLQLPELTSPENVISAMQIIYNDTEHGADERLAAYASLLDSAFVFKFQPVDILNGLPPSWGREEELACHAAIFAAQDSGAIYSLELRITHNPSGDLKPAEPGRDGWKEIFATNNYLRLMFNINDGLEVNGGQAEFKFPLPQDGLYQIGEWVDLPRPGGRGRLAVEGSTWGSIKAQYN